MAKLGIIGAMEIEVAILKSKLENARVTKVGPMEFFEGTRAVRQRLRICAERDLVLTQAATGVYGICFEEDGIEKRLCDGSILVHFCINRWQVEGQQAIMPRATFQDPMGNSRFSDRWIEDGSYLKLKSVTLSYDLPMTSEYLQGIQFWVQGNNLLTLTKYLGTDPESAMTSSVIGQGIDLGRLPQSTSIVAGVKINL